MVERVPTISNPLWSLVFPFYIRRDSIRGHFAPEMGSREDRFTSIFTSNGWNSTESRSGHGSTLAYTAPIRKSLEGLLRKMNVRTFLDAPCGDFNWMRQVALPEETRYIGGDIVKPLIRQLQQEIGGDRYSFRHIDIVRDPLPDADLWLCRDVLIHLPNDDAHAILKNFANSNIGYILTTTHLFPKQNYDINFGGFRYINLLLPPFSLPPPLFKFYDFLAPEPPRYVALWSREQVCAALRGGGAAHLDQ
jgi:SAM-dependent methyltransferase